MLYFPLSAIKQGVPRDFDLKKTGGILAYHPLPPPLWLPGKRYKGTTESRETEICLQI